MRNQDRIVKQKQSINTMKRADLLLIAICLVSAFLIGIFLIKFRAEGSAVSVSCDGTEVAFFMFERSGSEDSGTTYYLIYNMETAPLVTVYEVYPELPGSEAFNLFSITDGEVRMEAADCSDQICVHHNAITSAGESIICLPHRVVITIEGNNEERLESDNGDSETGNAELDGVVE